ncbi:MAG: TRAP transporter substrate-binding protein DctP [Betaproteobacteria bacterium]|nr:TRAP transporter substrate-binding protein DctP [Betaproteobacteria bacterium]MDH5349838.1 TRAP transporter substrate-binding protein DctP [Betaproteobacteria bacterium]
MKRQVAVALGAILLAAAPLALAQEAKLKAAAFLPVKSVYVQQFGRFVEQVNRQCAGKVSISVVGPEAIKSLEQWNALKNGVVDMHYGPPNYYVGAMPEGDVISVARNESAEQRANGAWALINAQHNTKLNAWYLTHLMNGVRFHIYTSKPGKDGRFDDLRLRSTPVYDAFFKSLGAIPVRMAPPEVHTALERSTVDGYGWPLWGIADFGWHKYTKYRHGPGFISAAVAILVNLDKWKGLEEAQRRCMTDVALWAETQWPQWREAESGKQQRAQDEAGIKYVDLGAGFARQAEELYWEVLTKGDPEFVHKVRPLLSGR